MLKNADNLSVKYEGKYIRIAIHKNTGKTYLQPLDNSVRMWFRFEREHYEDYKEYIQDFEEYCADNMRDMSYCTILNEETLEYYLASYAPVSVFINDECVYDDGSDVAYTLAQYKNDIKEMHQYNYYPFIENINIKVVSNHHYSLSFKVVLKHRS